MKKAKYGMLQNFKYRRFLITFVTILPKTWPCFNEIKTIFLPSRPTTTYFFIWINNINVLSFEHLD